MMRVDIQAESADGLTRRTGHFDRSTVMVTPAVVMVIGEILRTTSQESGHGLFLLAHLQRPVPKLLSSCSSKVFGVDLIQHTFSRWPSD